MIDYRFNSLVATVLGTAPFTHQHIHFRCHGDVFLRDINQRIEGERLTNDVLNSVGGGAGKELKEPRYLLTVKEWQAFRTLRDCIKVRAALVKK